MRLSNLSFYWRLVAGFAVMIVLVGAVGIVALVEVQAVSSLTDRLYRHPMAVSNAALDLKANVVSISRDMKNLVLYPERNFADRVFEDMARKDREFERQLQVIRERYLGDLGDVEALEHTYGRWRAFRDESLHLLRAGERDKFVARTLADGNALALESERDADRIIEFARAKAVAFNTDAQGKRQEALILVGLMIVGAVLLGLWVAAVITRGMTWQVDRLRGAMSRIAAHAAGVDVPFREQKSEIGDMARAVQVFKENAESLHARHWVKTHVNGMTLDFQAIDDTRQLGERALSRLAEILGAGHGAFFLFDARAERLELAAGYALSEGRRRNTRYALGQGLIGQCARERKTIVLSPVPADFAQIVSAVGSATPLCVYAAPLVSKGRLVGALELAFFGALDTTQQELLDELLPLLALNLDNLERAEETHRLLAESQRQAEELAAAGEELQAQQDELAQRNRDLNDRNHELQASEEELRSQQEELRAVNEQVVEKGRQLEATMTELNLRAALLDRASRYKSEFLANMSHELRTPLNSLLILSQDLASNDEGNLTADQVESARVIHEGGQNLLRLINDILDLSKVEAGKLDIGRDNVVVGGIASYLEKTFGHMAREKGLAFSVAIKPGVPEQFVSDGGRVEQILTNLIGNAIKFTESGGIVVRVHTVAAAAVPNMREPRRGGEYLAFAVADSGPGIPDDKLELIFGAFEQLDGKHTRKYGGSGLGLAISQKLAHLLQGRIGVESEAGRGSTFTLYLPLDAGAPDETAASATTTEVAGAGLPDDRDLIHPGDRVVLVIEDDLTFAGIVGGLVRKKGYRLLHAADGGEGLELARRFLPLGIVLDEMLPSLDGHEILSRLRAAPDTRDIPVHFVTALNVVEGLGERGVLGCLTKPVTREQIEQVLERLERADFHQGRQLLVVASEGEAEALAEHFARRMPMNRVQVLHHVDEAVARLGEGGVDLLVLDPLLPDEDGVTLLKKAARLPPVVIYSSEQLSSDDAFRLREFTDSIIIKSDHSMERLAEEVDAFLGSVAGADAASPPAVVASRFENRTILVVDDDMRNLFALSKILRGRGFRVLMAKNGARAIEQAQNAGALDAILMDIMMPEMDGCETIRRLRVLEAYRTVPIVAVTALAMEADRRRAIAAGASDYLSKPVDIERLLALLDNLMVA